MRLWAITLCVMIAIVALALPLRGYGGDTPNYIAVADNILFNGCTSRSPPVSADCVPHWGGNHFPGYPGLLVLAGLLSGRSLGDPEQQLDTPVILLNVILQTLAAWRFAAVAATLFGLSTARAALALVVLAALPLHVAFAGFLLTESPALAATVWLFAELLASLARGRLLLLPIAAALTAGLFLRYDAIALTLPVALTAFLIHPPATALRRGLLVALLVAIPAVGWTWRNVAVGLTALPRMDFGVGIGKPAGYLAWVATWSDRFYDGARAAYPLGNARYSAIVIPPRAFDSPAEQARVEDLFMALRAHEGAEFPDAIDEAFAALAAERRARAPLRHWLMLPLRRSAMMWIAPGFSAGFPVELGNDGRDRLTTGSWSARIAFISDNAFVFAVKGVLMFLRLVVILAFAASLWRAVGTARAVGFLVLGYALAKTLFLVYQGIDEPRLVIQPLALMAATALLMHWSGRPPRFATPAPPRARSGP